MTEQNALFWWGIIQFKVLRCWTKIVIARLKIHNLHLAQSNLTLNEIQEMLILVVSPILTYIGPFLEKGYFVDNEIIFWPNTICRSIFRPDK